MTHIIWKSLDNKGKFLFCRKVGIVFLMYTNKALQFSKFLLATHSIAVDLGQQESWFIYFNCLKVLLFRPIRQYKSLRMESGFQGVLLIENQLETSLMCRYGWHPKTYRETILKTRSIKHLNFLGCLKNEAENNGLTMSTTFSSAPASVRRE